MADTRDISTRPMILVPWLGNQAPNTLMVFGGRSSLTMSMGRVEETLHKNDRKDGIPSVRDAVDLRLHAWPNPGEPAVLCQSNNISAMKMIDHIFRLFSS